MHIKGVTYKVALYECFYVSRSITRVILALKVPFTKTMQQGELEGTRQLAKNFAEEGARFETYGPLAADDAFFYNGPVSVENNEVNVYAYAYSHGAQIVLKTSYHQGKQSFATVGRQR